MASEKRRSAKKPGGRKTGKWQKQTPPTDIYSEAALWECDNLLNGHSTRINGALAQVLKKYPDAYRLRLVSPEGA